MIKRNSKEFTLVIIFAAVFILMSILSPSNFLSGLNMQSMAFQLPEFGILAFAMMIVILTGGMNLSLTYTASLSGVIMAILLRGLNSAGWNPLACIAVSLAAGLVMAVICGFINGYLVAYLNVTPILATLGTMILFEGIGLNITQGSAISGFPKEFNWFGNGTVFGIPVSFIIFAVITVIAWLLFEKTPWGAKVGMAGNNAVAVEYTGVNVKKVLFKVYMVSALMCFIAGLIMTSRYNSMKADYGYSYMLQSILAVVLGGTSINGGYGKVTGTLFAVLILQVLSSGLNIFGVNKFFIDVIMGCLLIFVLTLNFVLGNIKKSKKLSLSRKEV